MSVLSLKRSASDAQLTTIHARPNKSPRRSMTRMDQVDGQGGGALAKWSEVAALTRDTCFALGDAVFASAGSAKDWILKGVHLITFREFNHVLLPTHHTKLLPEPPQPLQNESGTTPRNAPPASKSRPAQPNYSPTNLHASSSSSSSFYPPPHPRAQAISLSSSSPSPGPSRASGVDTGSTMSSVRNSPMNSKSEHEDLRMDSIRKIINQRKSNVLREFGVTKKRRTHILQAQHRQRVSEFLERELYNTVKARGYSSDFDAFQSYIRYRQRLEELQKNNLNRSRPTTRSPTPILSQNDVGFFKRAVENAKKSLDSPKPPKPFSPSLKDLTARIRRKNESIFERLHPKRPRIPDRLPDDAEGEVASLLVKNGVVSKAGREQVSNTDLVRLRPSQWLNDEIINFYGQLIVDRANQAQAAKENQQGDVSKVHYFSTFFWPKLQSGYENGRLAKWTKKVDIFSKDIIVMAMNHGNAHWTSAAIDFKNKRIVSFDSMGFRRVEVFKALRMYLNEEHKNKKKKPFDFSGWEDYTCDTYPEQENGFDCGVFTCQTLEYLSRGDYDFNFTQQNMPYFRRRMIWEIGRAKLGDPL